MALTPRLSTDKKTLTITSDTALAYEVTDEGNVVASPAPGFLHPGVLLTRAQLSFTAGRISSNLAPQSGEFKKLLAARDSTRAMNYASLSWTPKPVQFVGRGSGGSPSEGDKDELADAKAAYTHALLWAYTGNRVNALKAIEILNAWTIIQDHKFDLRTYSDGKLIAGWTGTMFARAAEIIRHTFTSQGTERKLDVAGWIAAFARAWWPRISVGHNGAGANWMASFCDSMIQIAVFCDNREWFDQGVAYWRGIVPSIFYMTGDKNPYPWGSGLPIPPPKTMYDSPTMTATRFREYWRNPTKFVSGLEGETGRDVWHMAMGFAAVVNGAETAYHQGVDLYGEQRDRLVAAFELQCKWMLQVARGTNPPTGWVFPAKMNWLSTATHRTTFEIGYHHFAERLGVSMPNTKAYLDGWNRTSNYRTDVCIAFEQLTHQGTP